MTGKQINKQTNMQCFHQGKITHIVHVHTIEYAM